MTFSEFANRLMPIIGDGANTAVFIKTLFEYITHERALDALAGRSENTYKAYYNGNSKVSQLAQELARHIEPALFERNLMKLLEDESREALCGKFSDVLPNVNSHNVEQKISELFAEILREAAEAQKNTPQSKNSERHQKSAGEKVATILDEAAIFEQYLNQLENKYESLKTLLYTDTPYRFYDFYVCNDLRIANKESNYISIKTFENITLDKLIDHTKYSLIVGVGGIGKSMMLRHLLLDYLKARYNIEQIPIYILLKNFTEEYPTLESFIFNELEKSFPKVICNFIKRSHEQKSFVLFLDGLDEISY